MAFAEYLELDKSLYSNMVIDLLYDTDALNTWAVPAHRLTSLTHAHKCCGARMLKAGADWTKGFEYLGIFSSHGLAMCDPELIEFGNVTALYVCDNQYVLGTVEPTARGYELVPLPGMPSGGIAFEGGQHSRIASLPCHCHCRCYCLSFPFLGVAFHGRYISLYIPAAFPCLASPSSSPLSQPPSSPCNPPTPTSQTHGMRSITKPPYSTFHKLCRWLFCSQGILRCI